MSRQPDAVMPLAPKEPTSLASLSGDAVATITAVAPLTTQVDQTLIKPKTSRKRKTSSTDDPNIPRVKRKYTRKLVTPKPDQIENRVHRDPDTIIALPPKPKKVVQSTKQQEEGERVIPAKERISYCVWQRIIEFCPTSFLPKARLVSQTFKGLVDNYTSLYVNCRMQNYGSDMPPPPPGLTERQYCDLLDGKGCFSPGCPNKLAAKTYWTWTKRWCIECWSFNIEREDRIAKRMRLCYDKPTLERILRCIPHGMQDSWGKPHDVMGDGSIEYVITKVYLATDVERIFTQYRALSPPHPTRFEGLTDAQRAEAQAEYQLLLDGLPEKRQKFLDEGKATTDAHMDLVRRIEKAIRNKKHADSTAPKRNRQSRKELFLKRSQEDFPNIPSIFVKSTSVYKAATRISRDGGTERGWQTLKPKIEKCWADLLEKNPSQATCMQGTLADNAKKPTPVFFGPAQRLPDNQSVELTVNGSNSNLPSMNENMQQIALIGNGAPVSGDPAFNYLSMLDFGDSLGDKISMRESTTNPANSLSRAAHHHLHGYASLGVSSGNVGGPPTRLEHLIRLRTEKQSLPPMVSANADDAGEGSSTSSSGPGNAVATTATTATTAAFTAIEVTDGSSNSSSMPHFTQYKIVLVPTHQEQPAGSITLPGALIAASEELLPESMLHLSSAVRISSPPQLPLPPLSAVRADDVALRDNLRHQQQQIPFGSRGEGSHTAAMMTLDETHRRCNCNVAASGHLPECILTLMGWEGEPH